MVFLLFSSNIWKSRWIPKSSRKAAMARALFHSSPWLLPPEMTTGAGILLQMLKAA